MLRLAQFVRRTPLNQLESSIRGPKKKKGDAGGGVIESTDIVNIFKERTDPEPLHIRDYPTYVQEFSLGDYSIHELMNGVMHNIKMTSPTQSTYKSYMRGLKRQRCKTRNQFVHWDQKPNVLNEENDPNNRKVIYNIFVKAAEDLELKEQAERQAAALEGDDDE